MRPAQLLYLQQVGELPYGRLDGAESDQSVQLVEQLVERPRLLALTAGGTAGGRRGGRGLAGGRPSETGSIYRAQERRSQLIHDVQLVTRDAFVHGGGLARALQGEVVVPVRVGGARALVRGDQQAEQLGRRRLPAPASQHLVRDAGGHGVDGAAVATHEAADGPARRRRPPARTPGRRPPSPRPRARRPRRRRRCGMSWPASSGHPGPR